MPRLFPPPRINFRQQLFAGAHLKSFVFNHIKHLRHLSYSSQKAAFDERSGPYNIVYVHGNVKVPGRLSPLAAREGGAGGSRVADRRRSQTIIPIWRNQHDDRLKVEIVHRRREDRAGKYRGSLDRNRAS